MCKKRVFFDKKTQKAEKTERKTYLKVKRITSNLRNHD